MSSSSHQHQKNRPSKKGVRFAHQQQEQKQQQQQDRAHDPEHQPPPFKKRKKNDTWNGDDDEDDVDKWNNKTEDDEEYQKVLEAKRKRRLQQKRRNTDEDDDDDDEFDNDPTVIDQQTSLGADEGEIAIEPFHMKQEESDGLGYFDGDTYVFRKAKEEEPDAWLDMLDEQQEQPDPHKKYAARKNANSSPSTSSEPSEDAVPPSRSELIGNMIPFVSDTETVIQALVRYGNLLQSMRKQQKQSKQAAASGTSNHADDTATASTMEMAQSSLNALTEASNELMLQHGMVDIYHQTRQDLLQLLSADEAQDQASQKDDDDGETTNAAVAPESQQQPQHKADDPATGIVQWEYMGNEDGQVHGPFSTADMIAWTRAGYFIGEQAVQVRSITTTTAASTNDHATIQEDLLADLMDDDDDDDDKKSEAAVNGSKVAPVVVLGEWTSSNQVDFAAHA